jgi:hypothetical protein
MNKPEVIASATRPARRGVGTVSQERWPAVADQGADLTHARAGPTCVRQLTDWGARAIKIEQPSGGDDVATGDRHGFDFQNLHRKQAQPDAEPEGQGRARDLQGAGEGKPTSSSRTSAPR